jgi:hypothetical protein
LRKRIGLVCIGYFYKAHPAVKDLVLLAAPWRVSSNRSSYAIVMLNHNNAITAQRRQQLALVLAGSAVGMLAALDAGAAPLHGRFAWKAELRPFNYWFSAQMASSRAHPATSMPSDPLARRERRA